MSFTYACDVIDTEINAIQKLKANLAESFPQACRILTDCKGKVVILAIGKSGHIGNKIAATFASTGTPAFAVNAAEASHGDLGMISTGDVVVAISHSGKTHELISLLPLLKRLGVPLIAMTGHPESPLAQAADVHLWVEIEREACPHNLAPTASTTATLVLGDALAVALLTERGFTKEDFAFSHPGGTLGKRLLLTVKDLMASGKAMPQVHLPCSFQDALFEMTSKQLGMTVILTPEQQLAGILTDGDLRRILADTPQIDQIQLSTVMSQNPKTISQDAMAVQALEIMESHRITSLLVTDNTHTLCGVIHMHHLLSAGVV